MGEVITGANQGEERPSGQRWSLEAGPFEPSLHLPGPEVIAALLDQEAHLPEDARQRIAAWGLLTHTLQLLNPQIISDRTELDRLKAEVGKAVMYSGKLGAEQRSQLNEILGETAGPAATSQPAISQALQALRERGVESRVMDIADTATTVMRIWAIDPEAKLPVPYNG